MNGRLEVVDAGIGNSIQDLGRMGYRHMGIAVSGSLDGILARSANALVGNSPERACIEVRGAGPALLVKRGRVRVALSGELTAVVVRADGSEHEFQPWRSLSLDEGEELRVGYLAGGTGYVAVSGGFSTPVQLGSRSTYLRAEIGTPLVFGLEIDCAAIESRGAEEYAAKAPWRHESGPIRVRLGPQEDHFTAEAIAAFLSGEYRAAAESDRMGMRREGESLNHAAKSLADIVSDGVTPGAVQVPGNGQPIILLSDCQTVGGYPKIATVITADLPRLAQVKPGEGIRFAAVDAAQARQALLSLETRWKWWAHGIGFGLPGAVDKEVE